MALPTAIISYDLSDLGDIDFDARRTRVYATTNIPGESVMDTVGNKVHIGGTKGTINTDGTGSIAVKAPGLGSNPGSWQTYIHVDYADSVRRNERKVRTFGPFTVLSNANLADLVAQQEIPPTYLSQVEGALASYVTAMHVEREQIAADRAYVEGLIVTDLGTTDGQTKALIDTPSSQSAKALVAMIAARSAPGLPAPLADVTIGSLPSGSVKAVGVIGSTMYGFGTGNLYQSTNGGALWTVVTALPSGANNVVGLRQNAAGQVILFCSEGVWLSSGWGGTVSWGTNKITYNGAAAPQPFSVGGQNGGTKFIVGEYGPFADSKYAHISTDGGVTWNRLWDSTIEAPLSDPAVTHVHGCEYDPWSDTFYVSEGHGGDAGIYHSTDNGTTWSVASGMYVANLGSGITASPTTITATDEGLVCGGDSYNVQGLHGVVRTPNPNNQILAHTWAWRTGMSGNNGWGHQAYRDPDTGVVYVMFRSQAAGVAPIIAAGTPTSGGKVYEWPGASTFTNSDTFLSWALDPSLNAVAYGIKGGIGYQIKGKIPRPRAQSVVDTGGALGGQARDGSSVAVGNGAITDIAIRAVAMGADTVAEADSVVIGWGARASATEATSYGRSAVAAGAGVAVGHTAGAGTASVAVGRGSAGASNTVAVGYSAEAKSTGNIAIGYNADADGTTSIAIGNAATTIGGGTVTIGDGATGAGSSVSIGRLAVAAGSNVAVGHTANANVGTGSVALGQATATTASKQVALGDRHIEMTELASDPAASSATAARLYVKTDGTTGSALYLRTATGTYKVTMV